MLRYVTIDHGHERRNEHCTLLARSISHHVQHTERLVPLYGLRQYARGPQNELVVFDDGYEMVAPWGNLREVK